MDINPPKSISLVMMGLNLACLYGLLPCGLFVRGSGLVRVVLRLTMQKTFLSLWLECIVSVSCLLACRGS